MTRRLARLLLAALAVALVAGACGGSGDDNASPSTTAPEEHRATAAEVASGLPKIEQIARNLAAAAESDQAEAKDLSEQIEPVWRPIEGTIKANDQDAYLSFEDSFAVLEKAADDGDAAKATEAAGTVEATAVAYLAKYPG